MPKFNTTRRKNFIIWDGYNSLESELDRKENIYKQVFSDSYSNKISRTLYDSDWITAVPTSSASNTTKAQKLPEIVSLNSEILINLFRSCKF